MCPLGRWPADSGREDVEPGRGCEVTIERNLDGPHSVVSVAGALEGPGGALLVAMLEYVLDHHGGPVAVDLCRVSHVDRHGLVPVVESDGVAVAGVSASVEEALTGLAMASLHRKWELPRSP